MTVTKAELKLMMGQNIKEKRLERKLSVEELAKLINLTAGGLGLIERGQRGASLVTLLKLSEIFDCTVDKMMCVPEKERIGKHERVTSLLINLDEKEVDFVIAMVKALRKLRSDSEKT